VIILVSPCLKYHLDAPWHSPSDTPPGFTEKRDLIPIKGFTKPVPGPARREEGLVALLDAFVLIWSGLLCR
jgi:hypothetical protein